MTTGIFDKTIGMLGTALDLRAARQRLISSNIANQETPGYKASDIRFEDELRKREGAGGAPVLVRTSSGHLPLSGVGGGDPRVIERAADTEGYDQNSVGIEGEMARLSENALMYSVASKLIRGKFMTLMTAIKEGGR